MPRAPGGHQLEACKTSGELASTQKVGTEGVKLAARWAFSKQTCLPPECVSQHYYSVLASQKMKAWTIVAGYYRDQGKLLVKSEIKLIMWIKLCNTG